MPAYTYTGATFTASPGTRDTTPAGTVAAQTWRVFCPCPTQIISYTCDIRAAGDYTLTLNGQPFAVVNGVTAGQAGVVFAAAAPHEVHGDAEFQLVNSLGAVLWYGRGNDSGMGGTGQDLMGWGFWQEPGIGTSVAGTVAFKIADGVETARIIYDSTSGGTFVAHTWTVTTNADLWLTGMLKRIAFAEAAGYQFSVDTVAQDSHTLSHSVGQHRGFYPGGSGSGDRLFLPAGAHTFKLQPLSGAKRWPYRAGTAALPTGTGAARVTTWSVWAESTGNKAPAKLFWMPPVAPGEPQNLVATPDTHNIPLTWDPPVTGDDATGYRVRVNGGGATDVGNVLAWDFTGLVPSTAYTLEVQAYSASGLSSPWATVVTATLAALPPAPDGWWRIRIQVGSQVWEVERYQVDPSTVVLPLILGWQVSESTPLPAQPDVTTLEFRLDTPTPTDAELEEVQKGATVQLDWYNDNDPDADPWQTFAGIVTSVAGQFVGVGHELSWQTTVSCSDPTMVLDDVVIGYSGDWPAEMLHERLETIAAEAGFTVNYDELEVYPPGVLDTMMGTYATLPARDASAITALAAIRATLRDAAAAYDPEADSQWTVGKWVYDYRPGADPASSFLDLRVIWANRPDQAPATELPGGAVAAVGPVWSRGLTVQPSWVIVDNDAGAGVGGATDGPPAIIRTSYTPSVGTTDARSALALLVLTAAAGFQQLGGWRTRRLRYDTDPAQASDAGWAADMASTAGWASHNHPARWRLTAVLVTDVAPELQVNADQDYLAGTLSGVRLLLPPDGEPQLELRVRPEVPPDVELPA